MYPNDFRYAVLGSGSKANSYIFTDNDTGFLVDNGFSCQELEKRCLQAEFDLHKIDFIFVTHLHSDHIRGIGVLSKKYGIPIVSHLHLQFPEAIRSRAAKRLGVITGKSYRFKTLRFEAFETSHDSECSLSYFFELSGVRICIITDTGRLSSRMEVLAKKARLLFLEANYDPDMLEEGTYPNHLKRRIASPLGHLSNEDAIEFVNRMAEDTSWDHVYFCHLSENNNHPEVLEEAIQSKMIKGIPYTICPRNQLVSGQKINIKESL